jgi:hypothetical protein
MGQACGCSDSTASTAQEVDSNQLENNSNSAPVVQAVSKNPN